MVTTSSGGVLVEEGGGGVLARRWVVVRSWIGILVLVDLGIWVDFCDDDEWTSSRIVVDHVMGTRMEGTDVDGCVQSDCRKRVCCSTKFIGEICFGTLKFFSE